MPWYAERLTDRLSTGVPDVWWADPVSLDTGWVELKQRDRLTQLPGVTAAQLLSIWNKQKYGALAALLCQTGRSWQLWFPRHELAWLDLARGHLTPDYHWETFPGGDVLLARLREGRSWWPLSLPALVR
jgi:hypothetical protein